MREMSHLPVAVRDGMTHQVSGGRTIKLNLILKCTCMVIWSLPLFQMAFIAHISHFDQRLQLQKNMQKLERQESWGAVFQMCAFVKETLLVYVVSLCCHT